MMRQLIVIICTVLLVASPCLQADMPVAEVVVSESVFLESAKQGAKALFKTKQGNKYTVIQEQDDFVKVTVLGKREAWILKSDVQIILPEQPEDLLSSDNEQVTENAYTYQGQENYRFPNRSSNKQFDLDVDGFYEVKASGRNYSPTSRDSGVWKTITNDPIYNKIPRDVLLGPMQLDFRSRIGIKGKLSDDLYVYYDIQQDPDTPSKYDVRVDYRDHHFQFFHLEAAFKEGEYLNIGKSLRGAKYEYLSDSKQFKLATGKERSNSKVIENFGTGSSIIKLSDKFIFPGSVSVYVNNGKKSEGSDYTVDYYKGEVSFASPPQTADYYKIIYEASNPISDYLPVLARRSFLGVQYAMKSEKQMVRNLLKSSAKEQFQYKERHSQAFEAQPFSKHFLSDAMFDDDLNFELLLSVLQEQALLTEQGVLAADYSPLQTDFVVPTSSAFFTVSADVKNALDLCFFEGSVSKTNHAMAQYSNRQLSPEQLTLIDALSFADSLELWRELQRLAVIDSQGFLRNDVPSLRYLFELDSAFYDYDEQILAWLKQFMSEPDRDKQALFILENRPVVLGSEELLVNDILLRPLVDYYIDYSLGTLKFLFPISGSDRIQLNYDYYKTASSQEEFIGNYSKGPYKLQHLPVVNGSAVVHLNNRLLNDIDDYIVHYDTGEINFNFEVAFPSVISVAYDYIDSVEEESKESKRPIEMSTAFVREFMPTGEENIVSSVVSENNSATDNIITLGNRPLTNTANLSIVIDGVTLSESDYAIQSFFRSEIDITTTNFDLDDDDTSISVSYDFINGFSTTYTFYINQDAEDPNGRYNVNEDQFNLTETPMKYGGIHYIRFHDSETGDVLLLEEGESFEVESYGQNNDGNTVVIAFKHKTQDSGYDESALDSRYDYPGAGDSFTIVYDYTPDLASASGDIVKQMFASNIRAQLSDRWSLDSEIAVAGDNFSENVLQGELSNKAGSGIDNDSYSLGNTNIVEDSEQVFLNGLSQTKNDDYTIIYKTGKITFRNYTPGPEDSISVFYDYYQAGADTASTSMDYSYATKLALQYQGPSVNAKTTFKYIDSDFNSVGNILETGGSTVLDNHLDWTLTPVTSIKSSYSKRTVFSKETLASQKLYKRQHAFDSTLKTRFLNSINSNQSVRYQRDVADPDSDNNNKHSVDTRVGAYESSYSLGSNALGYKTSMRDTDFLDRDNYKRETTQVISLSNKSSWSELFLLGNVGLSPSYYRSYSENQYSKSPTFSFSQVDQYKLSSSISPIQSLRFALNGSFEERQNKKSEDGDLSINQSASYGIDSNYNPLSWFAMRAFYNHSESLSPLLNQASDLNQKNSVAVNKFQPYYAFQMLGVNKHNPLLKPIIRSNVTASQHASKTISNDGRKETITDGNRYGISEIALTKALRLSGLNYSKSSSQTDNAVPQTTVSRNESMSNDVSYGSSLTYKSTAPILRHISYAYTMKKKDNDSESSSYATVVSGNRTNKNSSDASYSHTLSIKPPQLSVPNPFKRGKPIRFGSSQFSLSKALIHKVNETNKYTILPNSTDTELSSFYVDNRISDTLNATGSVSPFNLFTVSGAYSPATAYLNRNGDTYTGSTFQDKLAYNLSTSVSPFSFLTLSAGMNHNTYTQFKSPSANVSEAALKQAFEANNSAVINSYINNETDGFYSSVSIRKFFLGLTAKYNTLDKVETDLDGDTKEFNQYAYSGRVDVYLKRDMNLNYTLTFSRTNNQGGRSQIVNFRWTPLQKTYTKIFLDYKFTQTTGFEFNDLQQENSVQGDGDYIETEIIDRDDVVQQGSLNISLTFPINSSPYLNKFVLEGEGYLKGVSDKNETSDNPNSYSISGLVFKGTLHF